jgi:hypothetical protein
MAVQEFGVIADNDHELAKVAALHRLWPASAGGEAATVQHRCRGWGGR